MLRLHQTFGAHAGRVREFDQDVIRFGRLPTNDIVFDPHADLDASGNHAEIRREGGVWVLVDVGSRNGTLVDGRPVQRLVLRGNEEIEFGPGGPRVRVEILTARRGMPTTPATPVGPALPVSGDAPTMLAQAAGPAFVPPSPAPLGPLSPSVVAPMSPTPGFSAPPRNSPPPNPSALAAPKLYGQRTVEQMIHAAVAEARQAAASGAGPAGAHEPGHARRFTEEEAGKRAPGATFVLAAALATMLLVFCVLSGIVAFLWARAIAPT